jgi:acyl-coenzyme A thioesterase PaaI-like protein
MDLIDEGMCFICGENNPMGLKVKFQIDRENLQLTGKFTPRREHEGYKNIMHGGLQSALLDEAMVKLLWEAGISAVSASLKIRLVRPAKVGSEITIKGWVESRKGKLISTAARLEDSQGNVLSEATGKCLEVKLKEDGSVEKART